MSAVLSGSGINDVEHVREYNFSRRYRWNGQRKGREEWFRLWAVLLETQGTSHGHTGDHSPAQGTDRTGSAHAQERGDRGSTEPLCPPTVRRTRLGTGGFWTRWVSSEFIAAMSFDAVRGGRAVSRSGWSLGWRCAHWPTRPRGAGAQRAGRSREARVGESRTGRGRQPWDERPRDWSWMVAVGVEKSSAISVVMRWLHTR